MSAPISASRGALARSALLVVDVQVDFCPGGALAIPAGDEVVPTFNRAIAAFSEHERPVYLSRDWHPPRTRHFHVLGGTWPPHCVQETAGAAFHPQLAVPPTAIVISKGTSSADDGYSAFEGSDPSGRSLAESLRVRGVQTLYTGGLATDYCVLASALDALSRGFAVTLLEDAMRGLDLEPGDVTRAIDRMRAAGARVTTVEALLRSV